MRRWNIVMNYMLITVILQMFGTLNVSAAPRQSISMDVAASQERGIVATATGRVLNADLTLQYEAHVILYENDVPLAEVKGHVDPANSRFEETTENSLFRITCIAERDNPEAGIVKVVYKHYQADESKKYKAKIDIIQGKDFLLHSEAIGRLKIDDLDDEFYLITPYVNESDMNPINEAFSADDNAPWGFAHNGVDFFSNKELVPFQAAAPGVVTRVDLWQNGGPSGNWQVNVDIEFNPKYSLTYAFEPMSSDEADGQSQLENIFVSVGQTVYRGDIIGNLHFGEPYTHVHFGVMRHSAWVCPEPYFTPEARESILKFLHLAHPGAEMCY